MELNCEYLSLLYQRANKDIVDFLDVFNLEPNDKIDDNLLTPEGQHPMKTVFLEICFVNRLRSETVAKYWKFLIKRKKDIETVICTHFDLVKGLLIDDKK